MAMEIITAIPVLIARMPMGFIFNGILLNNKSGQVYPYYRMIPNPAEKIAERQIKEEDKCCFSVLGNLENTISSVLYLNKPYLGYNYKSTVSGLYNDGLAYINQNKCQIIIIKKDAHETVPISIVFHRVIHVIHKRKIELSRDCGYLLLNSG